MACINNRWTKRALASAGFGFPAPDVDSPTFQRWKPVFSVAEIGGSSSAAAAAEYLENQQELRRQRTRDVEQQARSTSRSNGDNITRETGSMTSSTSDDLSKELGNSKAYTKNLGATSRVAVVHGLNRPLFHVDLTSALQSAIANVERRGDADPKGVGTLEG